MAVYYDFSFFPWLRISVIRVHEIVGNPSSFLKDVEEVTLNDISSVAKKIISSPFTMASWGDGML
jgi:hypothetical protein